ncbi:HAMP domain-containing sensor histidine kinase [Paenibacillus chondroitinus]|uniref:histidine kinase n=1 Tax=Paenibacillus chondroitinus TaxID=59842 RepID=A0ABU6DF58_9BACL|nr:MULTISPECIES: HAMP domain-containing sensor histidine kinase [Paenibacillus]MCY9659271.1 HAMP domain-containing histidine kinase [Paenibacillus anseongense]MEB4796394.1 HAMP domain-containing sensor histidine kinase [Paenibacillus chondroitinus]
MSKLSRKLIIRITAALCLVFVLSFAVNTYFLPKFFLYQKKNKLAELSSELVSISYSSLVQQLGVIEEQYQVTIAYTTLSDSVDDVNNKLLLQFNRKGIALGKFWLTEESIAKLREGEQVNKIYDQSKLKSSFLVNFLSVGGSVFAVGESISNSDETIQIVNLFNLYIWIGMLMLLIVLSALYTARIVKPLGKLNETAEAISHLSFTKVDIQTGDEIESLARSINRMSDNLEEAHKSLEAKNANLQNFIADISHELKTPLSLIRVYASGMQDGLDDGTYAHVIQQQSDAMTVLIDRLLELSRLQEETYRFEVINLKHLLDETISDYRTPYQQYGLELEANIHLPAETWVMADRSKLESVLHNWLTNAMKYTSGARVHVTSEIKEGTVRFEIANDTDLGEDRPWELVWEPFYVMESSRSKKFSGTGLGLSISRAILQKHQAPFGLEVRDGAIAFWFEIPLRARHV